MAPNYCMIPALTNVTLITELRPVSHVAGDTPPYDPLDFGFDSTSYLENLTIFLNSREKFGPGTGFETRTSRSLAWRSAT